MKFFLNVVFVFFLLSTKAISEGIIIPYEINNKIGFLNEKLEVIYYPEFDGIKSCFENQCIAYTKDFQGKTKEYIVTSEKIYEKPKNADKCLIIGNQYYGFIYSFYKFSEASNDIVTTVIYSNITNKRYIFNNMELRTSVSSNCIEIEDLLNWPRVNYLNLQGKKYFSEDDDLYLVFFNKELNRGVLTKDYANYLIDGTLHFVNNKKFSFMSRFSDCGLILGKSENEEGYFDINGKLVIPISRFPKLDINFINKRLPVVINNNGYFDLYSKEDFYSKRWAIINNDGIVVKDNIEADSISSFAADGTAIVKKIMGKEIKYYLINSEGELICDENFDIIKTSKNGYSIAKKNGIDYLISSKTGKLYKAEKFKKY